MTSSVGHTDPLCLLPFDHRHSYLAGMSSVEPPLTADQHAKVADSKRLICEGFQRALEPGVPAAHAGILVDEEFGALQLRDAKASGAITAMSVERIADRFREWVDLFRNSQQPAQT